MDGLGLEMRAVSDAQPRHLLVTLLGDYWWDRAEYLPSAALVGLASEFGVTPAAARAALSRLRRRGLLSSSKTGRRTSYGLTQRARLVLAEGRDRIMAFGRRSEPWDGRWTVAAFSVPEAQRALRHVLRTRLLWLGFAPLYDGMWVSPHDSVGPALEVLGDLKVERATVMLATIPAECPPAAGAQHLRRGLQRAGLARRGARQAGVRVRARADRLRAPPHNRRVAPTHSPSMK
jgi:phenylacetic acid degradation operon negative regulatory protein